MFHNFLSALRVPLWGLDRVVANYFLFIINSIEGESSVTHDAKGLPNKALLQGQLIPMRLIVSSNMERAIVDVQFADHHDIK
jgi:hypothetical protein